MSKRFRKSIKRIKNWFIYIIVKSGLIWLNKVHRNTAMKFLQNLANLGFYLVSKERNKTIKHLTFAYGESKSSSEIYSMAKRVYINLGRNMTDAFRLSKLNPQNIDNFVESSGLEYLEKALQKGKGVLAITGHVGNWELMGSYLAMKGFPINVVGAPIYDPRLDSLVVNNRKNAGLKYIARGSATREIIRALRRNEVMGLLIDQDTKHVDGVFVDFFGKQAYTPVGPVILAMKTGAPVLPMAIYSRKDGTHYVEIKEELKLNFTIAITQDRIKNTQICSNAVEAYIRKHPTQWVWMHERWKRQQK